MTIDEAAEMRREQAQAIVDAIEKTENEYGIQYEIRSTDKFGFGLAEPYEVAAEYLRLTDPTPLTAELIEKELGSPVESDCDYAKWFVTGVVVQWFGGSKKVVVWPAASKDTATCHCRYEPRTMGDLRQIVRMLRGGGA